MDDAFESQAVAFVQTVYCLGCRVCPTHKDNMQREDAVRGETSQWIIRRVAWGPLLMIILE